MPRFKDQAICIRHIDWSETSQIVALLTREHGTMRGLAKGSKRTSPGAVARYCGGIELLTAGEVVATIRPNTDLAAITEWDLQQPFRHFRSNLRAHRLGLYLADVLAALTADDDPHPVLYDATLAAMTALKQTEQHAAVLLQFQWTLLVECGYKPDLDRDMLSDEPLGQLKAYWFDPIGGGFSCDEPARPNSNPAFPHRRMDTGPWQVRAETIGLLKQLPDSAFSDSNFNESSNNNAASNDSAIQRGNRLLCVYIRALIDRQLPTMRFVLDG